MSGFHRDFQDLTILPMVSFTDDTGTRQKENKNNAPNASAIPVTRPETTLTTAKPSHPLVGKPEKPASCRIAFTPCPKGLWSTPGPDTPCVRSQAGSTPPTAGTTKFQKEKTIAAPVREAARKPATDFRGARGSPRMGMRGGSGGVREPHMRPNVEAAVSAQERLLRKCKVSTGRVVEWMRTHIRIDNTAISRGYSESTKTTPMMYHITPFDCFCGPKRREDVNRCLVRNRSGVAQCMRYQRTFSLSRIRKPSTLS